MLSRILSSVILGLHLHAVVALSSSTMTAVSGTSSFATSCVSQINACFEDSTCSACLSGWKGTPLASECEGQYSSVTNGDACADLGASSCCGLGGEAIADSCVVSEIFVQYWGCYMSESSCVIEDMPCYTGLTTISPSRLPASSMPVVSPSPSPVPSGTASPLSPLLPASSMPVVSQSPSPVPSGTASPLYPLLPTLQPRSSETPTSAPTLTASFSDSGISTSARILGETSAPTASPTVVDLVGAQCANQTSACLNDEVCQGCLADSEILAAVAWSQDDFSECEIGYLDSPSDAGVCEVAGAMYCCSNDSSEAGCVANEASLDYWRCVFDSILCSMDDVTCMGGIGGSYRSDDETFLTDDGADAEGAASSHATKRWRGPRIQLVWLFTVFLAGIAVAAPA